MFTKLATAITILITFNFINCEVNTSLVMLQMMVRHGIRSVFKNYPNEPIALSFWDKYGGVGQLTPAGFKQLYDYGKYTRNNYGYFLNDTYDRSRVYVRSTDLDRNLNSGYAFLAGLFRPSSEQIWNQQDLANWLPIPVHSSPFETDNLFHYNAPCLRLNQLTDEIKNSNEYKKINMDNKDFLSNMSNLSGLNPLDLYKVWEIADNALVDEANNLPISNWVKENYEKIMSALDFSYTVDFKTVEMGKLNAGPLLTSIVENFKAKLNGSSKLELNLYIVHHPHMGGMQRLLNTSNPVKEVNWGSSYNFELRKDSSGNYYIKLYFKSEKPNQNITIVPVTIAGCDELCPYEKFLSLTADKLVYDINSDCNKLALTSSSEFTIMKSSIIIILMGLILCWHINN